MNLTRYDFAFNQNIKIEAYSILGTRAYQQDYASVFVDENCALAVLCDGMGGLNGGERASSIAAEKMIKDFGQRDISEDIYDFFKRETVLIDREVAALRDETGKALGAGTTLVAAAVVNQLFYWISIGDSKIYAVKDGVLNSIAREHNYRLMLTESLKNGKIDNQEYEREVRTRKADALISFIGMGGIHLMDFGSLPIRLEPGDLILLCSDGVCKSLSDIQIQSIINDNAFEPEIAVERLVDSAMEYGSGSQDNTTAVLLEFKN